MINKSFTGDVDGAINSSIFNHQKTLESTSVASESFEQEDGLVFTKYNVDSTPSTSLDQDISDDNSFAKNGDVQVNTETPYSLENNVKTNQNEVTYDVSSNAYNFDVMQVNSTSALDTNSAISAVTVSMATNTPLSGLTHIDALLDHGPGWNWQTPNQNILYYTFNSDTALETTETAIRSTSVSALTTSQQAICISELSYVTQITGIQFVETSNPNQADLHFLNADITLNTQIVGLCSWRYNYSYDNQSNITNYDATAYVYLDNSEWLSYTQNLSKGTYGYEILLHEIGHALGLKHPFDGSINLPTDQDNTDNTIMSYTHINGPKTGFSSYDIAALQWLYGGDGLGGNYGVSTNNKVIMGNEEANTLIGGSGNDILDGGLGFDTAVFNINKSAVTDIHHLKSGGAVITSSEGIDTLTNIESLSFLDGALTAGASGDVIKDFIASRPLPSFASIDANGATTTVTPTLYTGPVAFLEYQLLGNATGDVIVGSSDNDFMNLLGGNDAADGGAGDDVLDGGTGSNFLTGGGGNDTLFLDGRNVTATWSTVTDFNAGDQVNIWGWRAGTSKLIMTQENGGANGYTGATFHYDLDNNGAIDTSITFAGLSVSQVPTGVAMSVAGNGYLLIG